MSIERFVKRLADLGRIVTGKTPPTIHQEYYGGEVPFVTPSDMDGRRWIGSTDRYLTSEGVDSVRTSLVPKGALMVSCIGSEMGKVAMAERGCVTNQQINSLIVEAGDNPIFVYYCLSRMKSEIRSVAGGSAVPILNKTGFGDLLIEVPQIPEQHAIANILGTLDDKIELNRRMNETLEAMARTLFKSWFVDFEPVRAKVEGRDTGLPKGIADLFPDRLIETEFVEIPEGWRLGKIGEIADINKWTLGRWDDLDIIDYIEISEVMRGEVGIITRYARGEEPSRARRRLKHGDTALSTVRPDRGAYFLALNPIESLIASTGFAVLTPKDGNWAFLHILTTRTEFGHELGRLADGGAYPAIRPEIIGNREILLPIDSRLIAAFDDIAQPILLRAEVNRKESRAIAAIRDTLLPNLLSGEISIEGVARIAEEVH